MTSTIKYPINKHRKNCVVHHFIPELREINAKKWVPCVGCKCLTRLEKNTVGDILNIECDNNGLVMIWGFPDTYFPQTGISYGSSD